MQLPTKLEIKVLAYVYASPGVQGTCISRVFAEEARGEKYAFTCIRSLLKKGWVVRRSLRSHMVHGEYKLFLSEAGEKAYPLLVQIMNL